MTQAAAPQTTKSDGSTFDPETGSPWQPGPFTADHALDLLGLALAEAELHFAAFPLGRALAILSDLDDADVQADRARLSDAVIAVSVKALEWSGQSRFLASGLDAARRRVEHGSAGTIDDLHAIAELRADLGGWDTRTGRVRRPSWPVIEFGLIAQHLVDAQQRRAA